MRLWRMKCLDEDMNLLPIYCYETMDSTCLGFVIYLGTCSWNRWWVPWARPMLNLVSGRLGVQKPWKKLKSYLRTHFEQFTDHRELYSSGLKECPSEKCLLFILLLPLQIFQAALQLKSAEHLCQRPGIASWSVSFCNIKQQRDHSWFWNNFGISSRRGLWSLCQCGEFLLGSFTLFNLSILLCCFNAKCIT